MKFSLLCIAILACECSMAGMVTLRCSQRFSEQQHNYGFGISETVNGNCVDDNEVPYQMQISGLVGLNAHVALMSGWIVRLILPGSSDPSGEYHGIKLTCGALRAGASTGVYFSTRGVCSANSISTGTFGGGISAAVLKITRITDETYSGPKYKYR